MINFFFLALLFLLWFYSSPVPAEETPVLQAGLFAPFLAFLSRLWYGPTSKPSSAPRIDDIDDYLNQFPNQPKVQAPTPAAENALPPPTPGSKFPLIFPPFHRYRPHHPEKFPIFPRRFQDSVTNAIRPPSPPAVTDQQPTQPLPPPPPARIKDGKREIPPPSPPKPRKEMDYIYHADENDIMAKALRELPDGRLRDEVLAVATGTKTLSDRDAIVLAHRLVAQAPRNRNILALADALRPPLPPPTSPVATYQSMEPPSPIPSPTPVRKQEKSSLVGQAWSYIRSWFDGPPQPTATATTTAHSQGSQARPRALSPLEPSLVPDLDPGELAALALDCALAALGQWFGVLLPSPDMPLMPFQYRLVLFLTPIAAVYCPFVVGFTAFLEALERRGYLAPGTALAFGGYLLNLGLVPAEMLRSDFRLNLGMPLLLYRSLPLILFRLLLLLPLKLATVLCLVPFGPWILASLRRESPQSLLF